jgi:hypothetical protein
MRAFPVPLQKSRGDVDRQSIIKDFFCFLKKGKTIRRYKASGKLAAK